VQIFAGALLVLVLALLVDRIVAVIGRRMVPAALRRGNSHPAPSVVPARGAHAGNDVALTNENDREE
jgi:hypothetical protein